MSFAVVHDVATKLEASLPSGTPVARDLLPVEFGDRQEIQAAVYTKAISTPRASFQRAMLLQTIVCEVLVPVANRPSVSSESRLNTTFDRFYELLGNDPTLDGNAVRVELGDLAVEFDEEYDEFGRRMRITVPVLYQR